MSVDAAATAARIRQLIAEGDPARAADLALGWREADHEEAEACFLDGVCKHLLGQRDAALLAFDQALERAPAHLLAASARGALLHQLGRLEESLQAFRSVCSRKETAELHVNQAVVLEDLHRDAEALVHYDRALSLAPADFRALLNRCALLLRSARVAEALPAAMRLCDAYSASADAWALLAHVRLTDHDARQAEEAAARALALRASHPLALALHGLALAALGRIEQANADLRAAHAIDRDVFSRLNAHVIPQDPPPDASHVYLIEGHRRLCECDWSDYEQLRDACERMVRTRDASLPLTERQALAERCHVLPVDPDARAGFSAAVGQAFAGATPPRLWPTAKSSAGRRLRIGYLSGNFRAHAGAFLMRPVIAGHDRSRVEVIGYGSAPGDDSPIGQAVTCAFDRFHDLSGLSDTEAAWRIHRDGCDVLVDHDGFTDPSRPGITAQRPAPVQVLWLGYHGSLGGDLVDYYVTDAHTSPPAHASRWPEARLFMPHGAFAFPYSGLELVAPARSTLGLPEGATVACAMHRGEKIDPGLFDLWLQLLREHPAVVLWMLGGNDRMEQRLRTRANAAGVAPERVMFAPRVRVDRHLARLATADCFLDTRWYNAHTTMLDAIAANVPPVTWLGDDTVSRLGATIVRAAGLEDLVAHDADEYLHIAGALVAQPQASQRWKERMRANRQSAPLFDVPAYVHSLETAYEMIVERARAGKPPTDLHVPATAYRAAARA